MCELFAMSSDQPASLRYRLSEFATHGGERFANGDGWGVVFTQERDAYLFQEPLIESSRIGFESPKTSIQGAWCRIRANSNRKGPDPTTQRRSGVFGAEFFSHSEKNRGFARAPGRRQRSLPCNEHATLSLSCQPRAKLSGSTVTIQSEVPQPSAACNSPLEQMVASHAPSSRLVMAHVRRATTGDPSLCNTHPFRRTIGGQVRHFAHNGNLPDLKAHYQASGAADSCVGDTNSELAFVLLLERLAQLPTNAATAERFECFTDFCGDMRSFGDANFLYAEGETLYVHAHKRRYEENGVMGPPRAPGLHIRRLDPSEQGWRVQGAELSLEGRHRVLLASVPLDDGPWQALSEGATLVIDRGLVRLSSDAS